MSFSIKSQIFDFNPEKRLFSAFFWGVQRLSSSKIVDFRIFDWTFFFAWTLAASATSWDCNFNLSNLNWVSDFSCIYQLLYEILFVGLESLKKPHNPRTKCIVDSSSGIFQTVIRKSGSCQADLIVTNLAIYLSSLWNWKTFQSCLFENWSMNHLKKKLSKDH